MGWLRKKGRQIGRGIKKAFKGVGKVFNKLFGGLFKKLGPIGSIALMFFLPGIGQLFSQGLSWLQGGFSSLASGSTWAAGTSGAGIGAGAGAGAGATSAWKKAVGKIGETIFGQAGSIGGKYAPAGTTSTLTSGTAAAGGVSWSPTAIAERGLLGNVGAVHSTVTGAVSHGLKQIPGVGDAYQGFEDWLNQTRASVMGEKGTSQRWQNQQTELEKNILSKEKVEDLRATITQADTLSSSLTKGVKPNVGQQIILDAGETAQTILDDHLSGVQAKQNLLYTKAKGTPFFRDSRFTVDDPFGGLSQTGKPLQISNFTSEQQALDTLGAEGYANFTKRLEGQYAAANVPSNISFSPKGEYGTGSLRAVGRSVVGDIGTTVGRTVGGAYLQSALDAEFSETPRSRQIIKADAAEGGINLYKQNLVRGYQDQGYQGKEDWNSLYLAPYYSQEFQILANQAYAA